ncbi:MAG: acyl-CoA/acyl-ACP dehydrogenase [Chloroflexi bacterium]|nr:acyl-CoA/acyl-ACP dehydrogenase [Chloroflexota bacterium]
MDLSLTPAQEMLKSTAKDFVAQECPKTFVREMDEQGDGFSRTLWQKMADLGWAGMLIPEEFGGAGREFTDLAVLYEEMGRGLLPSPHFSSSVLCALILMEAGSPQQKQSLLPAIAKGEQILALALTEPDYGWEASQVTLSATQSGGGYRLSGTKLFVHDAHIADSLIVAARTRQGVNPRDGITLFLVDGNAAGLSKRVLTGFTGERQNELVFNNVSVTADRVIGAVDGGWGILEKVFEPATAVLCAYMVGGLQEVLEWTVAYGRTRQQFGVPIGTFQRVQDHVVEIVNHLDAARWTTYEALWKLDTHQTGVTEAVAVAKAVTSEAYERGTFHSHEVHAGIGISKEYGLHLYTKKARTLYSYLGDPTFHRKRIASLLAM